MRDGDLTRRDLQALGSPMALMQREWAPCRYHCPVHADVRAYIEAAACGRFGEAIDVIRRHLPFAAVCGRVCHHPCEANCRRNDVDEPVAIREVKRFVAETQGVAGATVNKVAQDKAAVAIVGAGPAGLSAALDLARLGYRPTVFERFPVAGGIPATAIPQYRLPMEVVTIDVDWICAHGVEVVTGVAIGPDRSIDDLRGEFAAVVIAAGLARSRRLEMPGAEHRRVTGVIEFLTALRFDEPVDAGDDVLVIGGGNVACDAARSAVRLGAARVRMMCLEDEQEMPAWEWERREAGEEGVEVIHRRGPVEVQVRDGEVVGVRARRVTRVFDDQERFDPQYDDTDAIDVACDTVILAIGQSADMGFTAGSGLATDARGRLVFDPATQQTNLPEVFACGEIVTPPGSVVEACASGRRAAAAVDLFCRGEAIRIDDTLPPFIEPIAPATAEKVLKVARAPVPTDAAEQRKRSFAVFEHTYAESAALCEARRCMNCGSGAEVLVDKCAACLTCLRVCPFDIPVVTDVARIDSTLCQACGMCVAECPANAIVARGREPDDLIAQTDRALARLDGRPRIVAYVCGHHASADDWAGRSEPVAHVAEIYLPSTSRISAADLLGAVERGADAVFVIACTDGTDRYPTTARRTARRVEQARAMLAEVGLPADTVRLLDVAAPGRDAVRAALAAATDVAGPQEKPE